jgi:hypothetical protein
VLNATGDAWTGVFKFDVMAPNGGIVSSGSGTHSATQIRPEPVWWHLTPGSPGSLPHSPQV